MDQYDLPSLLPAQYGAANELRREVLKAVRNARTYPSSLEPIRDYLIAAVALLTPAIDPGDDD